MVDPHQTFMGYLQRIAAYGFDLLGAAGLRRWLLARSLPPANETLRLDGCGKIEIRFDRSGVPHIRASTAADLFFAQGYCHARDRFFQMELARRVARGELAEFLGRGLIEGDRFFRRLGFRRAAEAESLTVDEEIRTALESYTAGVNAYLSHHALPVEYTLLRQTPRPWTVVDSLAFARLVAWNLSFGWENKLIRGRLMDALGPEKAATLEPRPWTAGEVTQAGRLAAGGIARTSAGSQGADLGGAPGSGGSNNWAVAPHRSATSTAMLANDPHLRPRIPGAWYVMHLQGGGYNVVGATMPGLIGVLIGHNERVAWGITVAIADTQDIFVEKRDPNRPTFFAAGDGWYEAEIRRETIHVRKGLPVIDEIVRTRHGPLLNGVLDIPVDGPPLSMQATTDTGHCSTRALLDLNRATDWRSFRESLAQWHFPTLNFVCADRDGTIAYKVVGQVPIRASGDGTLPMPGWTGQHDWTCHVPFDELPEIVNPPEGILATANSEPDVPCRHFLSRDYMEDGRKRRIMELLRSRERHTLEDMQAMQMDVVSIPARDVAKELSSRLDPAGVPELHRFVGWDGSLDAASIPAAIYEVFRERLLQRVFADLPPELRKYVCGQGLSEPIGYIGHVFANQGSSLISRLVKELLESEAGCRILGETWHAALAWLRNNVGESPASWEWGRLHPIGFHHPIGREVPLLDRLLRLSRGPYPIGGDADTIAHTGTNPWQPFETGVLSVSYRQVFDLGDWDKGRFILPTGQSGHPGSPHYDDMIEAWRTGEYCPMLFGEEAVERETVQTVHIN